MSVATRPHPQARSLDNNLGITKGYQARSSSHKISKIISLSLKEGNHVLGASPELEDEAPDRFMNSLNSIKETFF
jgi:hypothetical protein